MASAFPLCKERCNDGVHAAHRWWICWVAVRLVADLYLFQELKKKFQSDTLEFSSRVGRGSASRLSWFLVVLDVAEAAVSDVARAELGEEGAEVSC